MSIIISTIIYSVAKLNSVTKSILKGLNFQVLMLLNSFSIHQYWSSLSVTFFLNISTATQL